MNITELLQRQADEFPDSMAIIDRIGRRDRCITFGEFGQAAGKMTTLLRRSGLHVGDTVLLFQPMSAELYIAVAGILRGGMTAMFVDPSAGRRHLNRCCELVRPQGLIASPKAHLLRLASPALRQIPMKWSVGGRVPGTPCIEQYTDCPNDGVVEPCRPDTPALASFTSGSTGQAKPVIRTHGFLLAQHRVIEDNLSLTPGEVELVTMPVFVLANLASRVTSVIADADLRRVGEITAEPVVRQVLETGVDRLAASPAFLVRIVAACEREGTQLTSLARIFTGGGPVSPRLLDRLESVAPHADITVIYGSTEAEPISTLPAREMDTQDRAAIANGRGLLVGRPVRSLDVRVIDDRWGKPLGKLSDHQFLELCRLSDEPGEIVVSGSHVLGDYLNGQCVDENKFYVGQTRWHRTGDAGYLDDQGRLWLLGRCAARVDDEHGSVYPLGVEQAAMRNPYIGKAGFVLHRGQRVLAVTLQDSSKQPDVNALLKSLSFAAVDSIRIVKRLPVDCRHQSKIDYAALMKLLE